MMRKRTRLGIAVSLTALFAACGGDSEPNDACCTETPGDGGATGSSSSGSSGGSSGAASSSSGGSSGDGGVKLTGEPVLERTVWLDGVSHPWELVFLPANDGSALLTERSGKFTYVDAAKVRHPIAGPDDIVAAGEGGLLGMTLDPDFATNRYVYTCFSSNLGAQKDNRVVRFRLKDDFTALEQRSDLVTGMPYSTGRHSGCRVKVFGGLLYVGTGDAAQYANPQNLNSLGGKVLRVALDGSAAPGNPFANGGGDARVFTYGHRNVQGLAQQPGTDRIYNGEHGSSVDDEVNLIIGGRNFGWDPGSAGGYDESVPMTDLEKFPTATPPVWASGNPTTALSGITFLQGGAWRDWEGALVGAELKNTRLRVLQLDAAGNTATDLKELYAEQKQRLRTPVMGPDGSLYVLTGGKPGGDEIWRITPQ